MSALMKKYLTKQDIALLDLLIKAKKSNRVTVTCMGLYNHGKSTLLNTLIDDLENKTFKTADIRETVKNKKVVFGNIEFVDTPGLNARKFDDKRVMDAVKESDLNLFVHTVTTGEFNEDEIKFLNDIKKHWKNPQEFIERTIFVVSRIDKAENEQDIIKTSKKMHSQILEIFSSKPKMILVSAARYQKGKLKNKKLMIKKSNIELLSEWINFLTEEMLPLIQETRKERLSKQYDILMRKFNSRVQENKLEIKKRKKAMSDYMESLNKDIDKIERILKNKYSKIKGV